MGSNILPADCADLIVQMESIFCARLVLGECETLLLALAPEQAHTIANPNPTTTATNRPVVRRISLS